MACNGYTSSSELDAQHVSPHQTTKREKTTPASHVPAWFLCHDMVLCHWETAAKEVSGCSARLHADRHEIWRGIPGTTRTAGHCKTVQNRKAGCFTLLKRITNIKCVNSEFKSVDINPTKEVPSIGSMAPCRSHHGNHTRQEWIII